MNMINCPNCQSQVPAGAAFCDNCGASLAGVPARPAAAPGFGAAGGQRCPSCGESVLPGEAFCGNCGAALAASPPSYVQPPPLPSQSGGWPSSPSQSPSWPPTPVPPAPQAGGTPCPNCGTPVQPTDTFCDNCGQALTPASGYPSGTQIPAEPQSSPVLIETSPQSSWPPTPVATPEPTPVMSPVSPRLVVQASGATLTLAPGKNEYLIGREDPVSGSFPDVDLVPYGGEEGGVSRRHAQIVRRGDQFLIEDLSSVNYTFVNRQKVAPGAPQPLQDGDEIRLGRVVLQFKLR